MSSFLYYGMYLTRIFASYIIILMVIEEFSQVLDYLEIDPKIVGWSTENSEAMDTLLQELKKQCFYKSNIPEVIWKLDNAHNKAKKINSDDFNLPFYSLIVIAYLGAGNRKCRYMLVSLPA